MDRVKVVCFMPFVQIDSPLVKVRQNHYFPCGKLFLVFDYITQPIIDTGFDWCPTLDHVSFKI